jgi:hypothetical protein
MERIRGRAPNVSNPIAKHTIRTTNVTLLKTKPNATKAQTAKYIPGKNETIKILIIG